MATVRVIEPIQAQRPKLRVGVCVRVSTDSEDQQNSYASQIGYYTKLIEERDDWELVDVYADEGITGTKLDKRDEFHRMMRDARKGKLDKILVKSVSRFARNTRDCLQSLRELKLLGVSVQFEKENIDTMQQQSEFIITLYSSFAQAESESISKNIALGARMAMKQGKVSFQYKKLLGYRKGEDGKPEIEPAGAETVRRIYRSFLAGDSLGQIQTALEAEHIPPAMGVNGWSRQVIQNILTNERYIGDALLQKTFVTDCITKKIRKNNGILPQYYVENNHPAIISRELYNRIQEEIARRANKRRVQQKSGKTERGKYSAKYALTERLVCGECGTPYRRCTWTRNGKTRIVWRCISRLEYGTKYCKHSPTLDEYRIHEAILMAINRLSIDRDDVIQTIRQGISAAFGCRDADADPRSLQNRIAALCNEQTKLLDELQSGNADTHAYDERLRELTTEILQFQTELRERKQQEQAQANGNARLKELFEMIDDMPMRLDEYDDSPVKRIVERATVKDENTLRILFDGGYEVEAAMGE